MTPEAKVKKKVKDILSAHGAYYVMPVPSGLGHAGIPDFLLCLKGRFVGIECKANGNKPTALQTHHLESIRNAGGEAIVVDETNYDELHSWLHFVSKHGFTDKKVEQPE